MSDIVDDTTLEYQEQILDDLDDIKGSLEQESEYYDTEYQKKVLSSLKSLQKSVESLNESNSVSLTSIGSIDFKFRPLSSTGGINFSYVNQNVHYVCFDVSSIDSLSVNVSAMYQYDTCNVFLTDIDYNELSANVKDGYSISGKFVGKYEPNGNVVSYTFDIDNSSDYNYLYVEFYYPAYSTFDVSYVPSVVEPDIEGDHVTSGSAIELSLENIGQQVTFVGYGTAVLIGLIIFLLFAKGLRR